jgi:uncharacterized protein YggE
MHARPLVAGLLASLALAAPAAAQESAADRGITTAATAVVSAPQDIARFGFSVSVNRSQPGAAQSEASRRMSRVVSAVRAAGVAADDVITRSLVLVKVTRVNRRTRTRTVRYRAAQSVLVTVRDLKIAGPVVDRAIAAGTTGVSGPDFGLSDPEGLYRRALRVAFQRARRKAQELAEEAGVTLGRAIRIQEGGDERFDAENTNGAAGQDQAGTLPVSDTRTERVPTEVRPGREEVEAAVSVTFETS